MSADCDRMGTLAEEVANLKVAEGQGESLRARMKEKLAIAEALAQASLLTTAAARRRLAARRIQMDAANEVYNPDDYIPPKQLLIYLVRMGSFNSTPKIPNGDIQDSAVGYPNVLTKKELINMCHDQRRGCLPLLKRDYLFMPHLAFDKIYEKQENGAKIRDPSCLRVLQWNILAQSLGTNHDNFISCPAEALEWGFRRYAIIEEIIRHEPDIVCLQEVDHFEFIKDTLATQGYTGMFVPKPDSPCIYVYNNNGPDGCAIFYKSDKFELVNSTSRILEVWRVQSNQVSIAMTLRVKETGKELCVVTTHLKAKKGALLSKLRNEQGRDLLNFIFSFDKKNPKIICGDFNAEPDEPIYETLLTNNKKKLASAYASIGVDDVELTTDPSKSSEREPFYTTWKVREEGDICHTIDYVFYTAEDFRVESILEFPGDKDIGPNRVPSYQYPSDHFALVCDLYLK